MFPCSVEDIDNGAIHEALDQMNEFELEEYNFKIDLLKSQKKADRLQSNDFGYWLDNCGDDKWYCEHCLQPECSKRIAECKRSVLK